MDSGLYRTTCLVFIAVAGLGRTLLQGMPFPGPERLDDDAYLRDLLLMCPSTDCETIESELPCPDNMRITTYIIPNCPGCRDCAPEWQDMTQTTEGPVGPNSTQSAVGQNAMDSPDGGPGPVDPREVAMAPSDPIPDDLQNDLDNQNNNQQQQIQENITQNNALMDPTKDKANTHSPESLSMTTKDRRSVTTDTANNEQTPQSTQRPVPYQVDRGAVLLEGDSRMLQGIVQFLRTVVGRGLSIHILSQGP